MVRDILKWDDHPVSLTHFAESTVRGYRLAPTAPNGPVMITVHSAPPDAPLARAPALPPLSPRTAPLAAPPAPETHGAHLLAARIQLSSAHPHAQAGTPQH